MALGGFKFVSKIIDQFTKWSEVFLLKAKSDVVDSLQLYNQHTVIPSGYRLGRVKGDRGGEFTGNAFRQYWREVGVRLEFAATNTPQQIGANERVGRTLAGMVRCLLADSGLPHFLWGELFLTASYLCNRPSHSALNHETPYKPCTAKAPISDTFGLSGPERWCTLKHIKRSSTLALGKDASSASARTAWRIASFIRVHKPLSLIHI